MFVPDVQATLICATNVPSVCTTPVSVTVTDDGSILLVALGSVLSLLVISTSSADQLNAADDVSRSVSATRRSPASPSLRNFQPTTSNSFDDQP